MRPVHLLVEPHHCCCILLRVMLRTLLLLLLLLLLAFVSDGLALLVTSCYGLLLLYVYAKERFCKLPQAA
jgi:hypothetical protein